ncbi:helix-turn-helix domain-containing protein [Nonomuraea jabiensis]|uniref:helix-turn-helix domain-containing protein n=1 Tax=Nonomuraea jabiensis TaxID=882448 RepID=UPI00368F07D1
MIELRSADVRASDRFAWWRAVTERELMPTVLSCNRTDDFHVSLTILQLGHVTMSAPHFNLLDDMGSRRTGELIRRSDPEQWWLTLVRRGTMWIEQDRNHARLGAGDLVLHSTCRPFRCEIAHCDGEPASTIALQMPRRAVDLPDRLLRDHVAQAVPSAHGAAALLARFMESILQQRAALGRAENDRLGTVVSDLATMFLAEMADATHVVPAGTRRQALIQQIKGFVRLNLARRDLSPTTIAAAHHISVRYLHHLFQHEARRIGEYIRHQRLERCRADLADPLLDDQSVARIAARWGFADAASFNRAFKSAYDVPPGDYRAARLRERASTSQADTRPAG